jgi:hypothetical protein
MTPAEVIQLLDDPDKLMRRCYLHIAGGATRTAQLPDLPLPPANGQAQIATFSVSIGHQGVSGFTTGLSGFFGLIKDRPFVKFTKQHGAAMNPAPPDHFNAYYIPMVQTGDVLGGTSHYTLPTGALALDIMITSKLSGCTFSVGSDGGGAALVSHVQPDVANVAGSAGLSAFAQTNMAATRGEFRKTQEYDDLAAVIGHRNGAVWTFYMQATTTGTGTNYVISGTQRL